MTVVWHYEEFCQKHSIEGESLSYYNKLPDMLHLMSNEDIISHIERFGSKKVRHQRNAVIKYLKWLHNEYHIDMIEKIFNLQRQLENSNADYIGFFSLNDLKHGIENAIITLETSEHPKAHADYDGLYTVFYLEWFGIKPQSIHTIMLEDVTDMGRKIYIPAENRTVEITDEAVADYLWAYKNKTGAFCKEDKVETLYKGNTYYRTTRPCNPDRTDRRIYNARSRFVQSCEDIRFSKNNIYLSGRFYEMLMIEKKESMEFSINTKYFDRIRKIFNDPDVADNTISIWIGEFYKYKRTYLSRL